MAVPEATFGAHVQQTNISSDSVSFAMQLTAGQLIRVTCTKVIDYPHDGIVSMAYNKSYSEADAADVMMSVRVIHFCRGDPQSGFPDGTRGDPLDELRVRETTLAWFVAQGRAACIVAGPPSPFLPDRIVSKARDLLGAGEYKLAKRNCQSFASHCYYGRAVSVAVLHAGYTISASLVLVAGAVLVAAYQFAHTPWAM